MLLLILLCNQHHIRDKLIYIPLCFYLYFFCRNRTYLYCIYIPLCFYLYHTLIAAAYSCQKIYIPLCFYLYFHCSTVSTSAEGFTFHYASTYTVSVENKMLPSSTFTFHYASTYTLSVTQRWHYMMMIYIPLCFYLYSLSSYFFTPIA